MSNELKNKIFISHSGKDKEYVKLLTELLEDIGLSETDIFCSSMPGYGIPLNNNIYDYLSSEFKTNMLIVLYALSDNYYESVACLNEMGASWVLKNKYTTILLPGFEFKNIEGAIDPQKIGIKLDGDLDELKHCLCEFKDFLINRFNLNIISPSKWERIRDEFINKVKILMI